MSYSSSKWCDTRTQGKLVLGVSFSFKSHNINYKA